MPYGNHEFFVSPDDEVPIWRYIDFNKYIAMLHQRSLYFTALRTLRSEDPFEGTMTSADRDYLVSKLGKDSMEELNGLFQTFSNLAFVNCWHVNKDESMAMWRLYSGRGDGIAIKSSFRRLLRSFDVAKETVFIGLIQYVDFTTYLSKVSNAFENVLIKRDAFKYEAELRAVYLPTSGTPDKFSDQEVLNRALPSLMSIDGFALQVDLQTLIDQIYVSPFTPNWIFDAVRSVTGKYGLGEDLVLRSMLGGTVES